MDETEFWGRLEYGRCREFTGLAARRYRSFWCDGLVPEDYVPEGPTPRVTGRCWIGNGRAQVEWDFALILPGRVTSREGIVWSALLPAEGSTRWMAFDEYRCYVEIEPAAAVPDLA